MGILEWVAILVPTLGLAGHIIKVYADQQKTSNDVDSLLRWKGKMDDVGVITNLELAERRLDCRTELYKDINRIEARFDKFLEMSAKTEEERKRNENSIKDEIRSVRECMIRLVTLLENKNKE